MKTLQVIRSGGLLRSAWLLLAAAIIVAMGTVASAAPATEKDVEKLPGYIDLNSIEVPAGAEDVRLVDLGPALLRLAAGNEEEGNTELNQLLSQIYSVRVKSFSINEDQTSKLRPQIEQIENKLVQQDWQRLVHIKEGDEIVSVSMKSAGDRMGGLMVIAFEPGDEATFINIVGDLDLSSLVGLASTMGGIDLDELVEKLQAEQAMQAEESAQSKSGHED
jgi:hypothetical protein